MAVLILAVVFLGIALVTYSDALKARQAGAALPPTPAALPVQERHVGGQSAPELVLALPEPARSQAWALLCLLTDGLGTAGQDPHTHFLLTQTATSYFPETLRAYAQLSAGARAQLSAQGQRPEDLLGEQLSVMTAGVQEALRRDHAAADRLLAQGHFLRERFGAPGAALSLPEDRAPEPPR